MVSTTIRVIITAKVRVCIMASILAIFSGSLREHLSKSQIVLDMNLQVEQCEIYILNMDSGQSQG